MYLFKRKCVIALLLLSMILGLCGCGTNKSPSGKAEIALITDIGTIHDGTYNEYAWNGVSRYSTETGISSMYYQPSGANTDAYLEQIKIAVSNGAKVVVCPGPLFENAVYKAQKQYKKVDFILLDGVPHNEDYSEFLINDNVMAITFAEEQAGFLAGYAAVREGYTNIGFIGGVPEASVIRYGYGFVQGADFAAIQTGMPVSIRYTYANTFDEDINVVNTASSWYANGTSVIFACGGSLGRSVIKAAEEYDVKVIGVDTDQSKDSNVVLSSAIKSYDTAVYNAICDHYNDTFEGGNEKHLTARDNGVKLPINSSRFETFTLDDYSYVYDLLVDGLIEVYNSTDIGTCEELTLVNTEVSYIVSE